MRKAEQMCELRFGHFGFDTDRERVREREKRARGKKKTDSWGVEGESGER